MAKVGRRVIPAASMSNFRRVIDYQPIYMAHGKGGRIYDIDGNEYLDFSLSYGPAVLGHSNQHLQTTLKNQIDRLYTPNVNDLEVLADYSAISDEPDLDFTRRLVNEYKVAAIPTSVFYHRGDNHKVIRFCFAKKEETMDKAAERLCRI